MFSDSLCLYRMFSDSLCLCRPATYLKVSRWLACSTICRTAYCDLKQKVTFPIRTPTHKIFQRNSRNFQELQFIIGTANASQRKCFSTKENMLKKGKGRNTRLLQNFGLYLNISQKTFNFCIYMSGSNILLGNKFFCHFVGQCPLTFMCLPYLYQHSIP